MVSYTVTAGNAGVTKIICAWCKRDMGERAGGQNYITHGICTSCKALLMDELQQMIIPMKRQPVTSYKHTMGMSPFRLYI